MTRRQPWNSSLAPSTWPLFLMEMGPKQWAPHIPFSLWVLLTAPLFCVHSNGFCSMMEQESTGPPSLQQLQHQLQVCGSSRSLKFNNSLEGLTELSESGQIDGLLPQKNTDEGQQREEVHQVASRRVPSTELPAVLFQWRWGQGCLSKLCVTSTQNTASQGSAPQPQGPGFYQDAVTWASLTPV